MKIYNVYSTIKINIEVEADSEDEALGIIEERIENFPLDEQEIDSISSVAVEMSPEEENELLKEEIKSLRKRLNTIDTMHQHLLNIK